VSGYQAVVFDMDGVLVDSEPAFFAAVNDAIGRSGKQIAWDDYKQLLGTSVEVTRDRVIEIVGLDGDPRAHFRGFDGILIKRLSEPKEPLPGTVGALDALAERGVPYALATSSTRPWMEAVLTSAGILARFPVAVTADDLERMKPAPDIYLKAAGLLATPPERCIAVEDTIPGITSAKAAGMFAIQVRASSTALAPIEDADLVIDSLEEFPFELLDV